MYIILNIWCPEVSRSRGFAVLVVSLLIWKIRGKMGDVSHEFLRSQDVLFHFFFFLFIDKHKNPNFFEVNYWD